MLPVQDLNTFQDQRSPLTELFILAYCFTILQSTYFFYNFNIFSWNTNFILQGSDLNVNINSSEYGNHLDWTK